MLISINCITVVIGANQFRDQESVTPYYQPHKDTCVAQINTVSLDNFIQHMYVLNSRTCYVGHCSKSTNISTCSNTPSQKITPVFAGVQTKCKTTYYVCRYVCTIHTVHKHSSTYIAQEAVIQKNVYNSACLKVYKKYLR